MSSSPIHTLDDTANKIFTKELVSSSTQYRNNNSLSISVSRFDQDLKKCIFVQKNIKSKAAMVKGNSDDEKNININNKNCNSSESTTDTVVMSTTSTSFTRAKVHFADVTIQEYSIQPGDNPGGNKGCPLTIGWEPISTVTLNLDIYESVRDQSRRSKLQLALVSAQRELMLKRLGHSRQDIMAGTKAANQTRRNRYETISRLRSSNSQEMLEGVRKTIHNFVTCGKKKQRERKFLAPYLPSSNSKSSQQLYS